MFSFLTTKKNSMHYKKKELLGKKMRSSRQIRLTKLFTNLFLKLSSRKFYDKEFQPLYTKNGNGLSSLVVETNYSGHWMSMFRNYPLHGSLCCVCVREYVCVYICEQVLIHTNYTYILVHSPYLPQMENQNGCFTIYSLTSVIPLCL